MKNFNAVSHNHARRLTFRVSTNSVTFEFNMAEARLELVGSTLYLNVHSVTRNVVDTE